MKTTTITCDVCHKDISNQSDWEQAPSALRFSNWTGCTNPMGKLTGGHQQSDFVSKDTCCDCSRYVAQAVYQAIEARRKCVATEKDSPE